MQLLKNDVASVERHDWTVENKEDVLHTFKEDLTRSIKTVARKANVSGSSI